MSKLHSVVQQAQRSRVAVVRPKPFSGSFDSDPAVWLLLYVQWVQPGLFRKMVMPYWELVFYNHSTILGMLKIIYYIVYYLILTYKSLIC